VRRDELGDVAADGAVSRQLHLPDVGHVRHDQRRVASVGDPALVRVGELLRVAGQALALVRSGEVCADLRAEAPLLAFVDIWNI
jgi:hypothetical protein